MTGRILTHIVAIGVAAACVPALLHAAQRVIRPGTARAPEALPPPPATVEAAPPPPRPAPAPRVEPPAEEDDTLPATLEEQRAMLFAHMEQSLDLPLGGLDKIKAIVNASPYLGQGNPKVTKHPMKRSACRAIRREAGLEGEESSDPVCGRKNMVPVYNTDAGETPNDAKLCIDRFEFPDIACDYPVVYASAKEAAELCEAAGKRLCDAHEWEGACAGAVHPVEEEYAFGERRPYATWLHNKKRAVRWSYGEKKNQALCATQSPLTPGCVASGWSACGTNTYPAGSFPACKSPFGVYDLNGNAAEHMNLPLAPEELMSRGGSGATEMKGSWFIFGIKEAHEDDCRWRAKDWHPSKVADAGSHRNYHLGFRCCMDVSG